MARLFDVSTTADLTNIDAGKSARLVFTVTNTTQKPQRGSLRAKALDSGQGAWLDVVGDDEREFAPGFTHQVELTVTLPPGTSPGKFRVRLDALSVANPDDDYTEGPVVGVNVGAGEAPPKPSMWWVWLIVGILVLALGGLVYWLANRKKADAPPPPPAKLSVPQGLVGQPLDEAGKQLAALGLKLSKADSPVFDDCAGKVVSSDPAPGSTVDPGATVKVAVGVLPYGPDTCRQGYVWRDAFNGDHVCVTPQSRTQAAQDNQLAPSRRELVPATAKDLQDIQRSNPRASEAVAKGDFVALSRLDQRVILNGGGLINVRPAIPLVARCKAGFYERRAEAQDRICVTEAVQLATAAENQQADSHRACSRR